MFADFRCPKIARLRRFIFYQIEIYLHYRALLRLDNPLSKLVVAQTFLYGLKGHGILGNGTHRPQETARHGNINAVWRKLNRLPFFDTFALVHGDVEHAL